MPEGGDDVVGPALAGSTLHIDEAAVADGTVVGAGATAAWHFTVDEPLFSLPTAVLVSDLDVPSLPMAVLPDDDGEGFSLRQRIAPDAGVALLTPVVSVVDMVGNPSLVELASLSVDTVAPADVVATLTPGDVATSERVAVAVAARDDHAVTACIQAVNDDDTTAVEIAARCTAETFGALARTVTLPDGNGDKRIVAVVRDAAGNTAAPVEATIVRLDGGSVNSAVTLSIPVGQHDVKPGDTIDVAVAMTAGAEPVSSRLLVDGVARDIVVGFASVGADRVEGSFVVPTDIADRSTLALQVIARFAGRESDPEGSQSDEVVVDATAPEIELVAPVLAVSARTVHIDVRQARADTIDHFVVAGDLDSGAGNVGFATGIDVVLAETAEGDALDAIKVRDVRVRAVDGAGNVSAEDTLRFRLLPDAALGSLSLRNGERQLVAGVKTRTRDPVAFGGTVDDSAAVLVAGSGQLVYLNESGAIVCKQDVPTLGLAQGVFVGSARTTVCVEEGAASVHLEAQIAFAGGAPTALSSDDLFIDNDLPTVTALAFVPVGDQRNNSTNTTSVQVAITATDAHTATVAFSGDVVDDGVNSVATTIDGARTFDLNLVSLNGGAQATRTVIAELEDEVGNRALRVLNLSVDTTPPAAPRVSEVRVVEQTSAPTDPLSTATPNDVELLVQSPVIDSADRLLVLVEDDVVVEAPVEVRGPDNRLALPAGTGRVTLVAVDDAGNRSASNPVVVVPRLAVSDMPAHPLGPTPTTFTVTSSVSASSLGIALGGALAVHVGQSRATCAADPDAVDTRVRCTVSLVAGQAPEGRIDDSVGAAVIRVDLTTPRVVATSGTPVVVDTTPPVLSADTAVLDVVSLARGNTDVVVGADTAVLDFAGSTPVGEAFAPHVVVTSGGARAEGVAQPDGSFVIDVGDFGDDVGSSDVVVTATDAAGNVGASITLFNDVRRPVLSVQLPKTRFRGEETIVANITATDASTVALPAVSIGGAAAGVTSVSSTQFTAELVVATPVVTGVRSVVVDVVDAAGNTQRATSSVTVDGDAPIVTPRIPGRTNQARVDVDVVDAAGSVATVSAVVRDVVSNAVVFNGVLSRSSGATFSSGVGALVDAQTYTATFSATDDVGNTATASSTFVFDTSPPVVTLTIDTSDPYETHVPFTVDVAGEADLSTLECRVDSGSTDRFRSCNSPDFGLFFTPGVLVVAPGQHLLGVRVRDTAGNQSSSDEVVFTVRARRLLAGGDGVWCAIDDSTHEMRCWGNQTGELDVGEIAGPVAPRVMPPPEVPVARRWRKVAVRKGTICALDTDNVGLFCWGDNTNARAMRPAPTGTFPLPGAVERVPLASGLLNAVAFGAFLDVALFDEGGCVLDSSHRLSCWGKSLFNTFQEPQASLQQVGVDTFDSIVAGGRVVCAASFSGAAACFGDSTSGQTLTGGTGPGAIDSRLASDVGDISTSGGHSCVVRRIDRSVSCAGDDLSGAVTGFENFGVINGGSVEPSRLGVATRVIAAGDRTCALGIDGRVRCQGQLAHGEIPGAGRMVQPAFGTLPVLDGVYDDITADSGTICGVERGSARVLCVGENGRGQIDLEGIASADLGAGIFLPSPVRRLAMVGHTVCASLNDGRRFCMGDNPRNRWVVDNPVSLFTSDTLIAATTTSTGGDDVFAMTDDYACAAKRNDFTFSSGIVCVGDRAAPLGRQANSPFDALLPTTVTSLSSFTIRSIALSDSFGCAAGDSDISCWGRLPTTGQTTVAPVQVAFGSPFGSVDEIAVGDEHLCQRTTSGVQCLGDNGVSQLGSSGGSSTVLRNITATAGVTLTDGGFGISSRRIAARGDTTCVTTSSGPACWGSNAGGLAGGAAGNFGGPLAFPAVPVPRKVDGWDAATGNCSANDVDVGRDVACASCSTGGLYCWGGREPVANDPQFLRQLDNFGGYSDVAVSDDGVVCAVQFGSTVRCFGDLSFGLSGTGDGFRETATEVVLP